MLRRGKIIVCFLKRGLVVCECIKEGWRVCRVGVGRRVLQTRKPSESYENHTAQFCPPILPIASDTHMHSHRHTLTASSSACCTASMAVESVCQLCEMQSLSPPSSSSHLLFLFHLLSFCLFLLFSLSLPLLCISPNLILVFTTTLHSILSFSATTPTLISFCVHTSWKFLQSNGNI